MMWLLLFGLTALVVLLPMLPAIDEWRRPTDLKALYIDTSDALDPPFLARAFAARLADAVASGDQHLDTVQIVSVVHPAVWPLTVAEQAPGSSRRVWHGRGDIDLPGRVDFLAEVTALGSLRTARGGVYRALWAGSDLCLAAGGSVTHWAHGAHVEVGQGCRLAGRVSADDCITVLAQTSFRLLHAPTVRFAAAAGAAIAAPAAQVLGRIGLPKEVVWDAVAARGTSLESLAIADFTAWRGNLVCRADLRLGAGCNALGSLKAHGVVVANAHCRIDGSIVAEGGISLGEACVVRGSVISEAAIVLGAGCVIGAIGHPATVSAPRIEVGPGVTVHGTLWASEQASTPGSAVAPSIAQAPTRSRQAAPIDGVAA